jgi:peptidoglycan/xylan/chitin deacetylase (PgdA/CDA1 family)
MSEFPKHFVSFSQNAGSIASGRRGVGSTVEDPMRQSYLLLPALLLTACDNTQGALTYSQGGSPSDGGSGTTASSNKGGTSTQSSSGTNSTTSTGGASNTGGSQATGGSPTTGGSSTSSTTSPAAGGTSPTGGTSTTGGTRPTGGTNANGGGNPRGGSANGGNNPSGGSGNGGAPIGGSATGGNGGGAGPKGGNGGAATGGTKAIGGSATGGTSTSSGGAVASSCANLTFAAGATGKAKPSGTAGGLKVLDWAGFKSAISYTFDDANSSQISNYKALNDAGGHYTFYLITSKTEAGNAVYKTAVQDGHEMGNHTSDHSNCTSGSTIDAASSFIKSTFGVTAYAFAAPNGSSACNVTSVSSKFLTDRSVNGGSMGPGDISKLTWLPSDIATTSNMAPTANTWRTICIHGFTGGSDGAYQPIALDSFTSAAKAAVSGGSWVETVTNVAAYQVGQNAISKATGNSVTWTLPAVFPPNMCVRVTTTGGTVKQNGNEVPWDDHGYYQISLDAKSLTVE